MGMGMQKEELLELILKKYSSERKLYGEYMNNPDLIEKRLKEGAEKARKTSSVLTRVKSKLGFSV